MPVEIQLPSYLAIFSEQKYITLLYIKMTNIRKSFLINKILIFQASIGKSIPVFIRHGNRDNLVYKQKIKNTF